MTDQALARPYPRRGEWVAKAACASPTPPDFHARLTPGSRAALQALCATCPVAAECLDYALACEDLDPYGGHGFWAGLTHKQRNALRQQLTQESA